MIETILGLILLVVPFLLIGLFSDKKRGFIYVLFFLLLSQVALALLTQALGIFYYWVVVGCTLFIDIVLLFVYLKIKRKTATLPTARMDFSFTLKTIDWVIIFVALISILSLYQVHYNYTGKINLATDQVVSYHEVKNMVYPYPYFSDEWYAVSLVQGAIDNHSLPVKNLLNGYFFPNLELFFHSFIAQLMLLLGLNPLLHYTILSIFLNALIVVLVYLFLRISNISKLTAGICSLLTLYITCGANLPGLWQLVPFNFGIIFFLLSICFMGLGGVKTAILSIISASLFYPPLIPFYFVGLLIFLLHRIKNKENLFRAISYGLLSLFFIVPIAYILFMLSPLAGIINHIFSRIFFVSFMAPYIPQLYFYNIIPMPAILLAIFGLYYICKNKASQTGEKWILLSEFIMGIIFWFVCSSTVGRFFAEYERVVIFTSIIVVVISGFGLKQVEKYIVSKFQKNGQKIIKITEIAILFVFFILIPFYTNGENWKKIISLDPTNNTTIYPKSPANNYLTDDDLKIFKDIKGKRFLSIPWKGTVIGVATGNYPILMKEGTISIGLNSTLDDFLKADCLGKERIAKRFNLDYIYIYEFDCPSFEKIAESNENLVLYKVKND